MIYELALPVDVTRLRYVAAAAGVLVAGGLLAWRARRDAAPLVAAAAYAVLLAPVLGLTQCGPQEVADRYSSLPSIPLAFLAGGALHRVLATESLRVRLAAGTAGVAVLALLAVATARQTRVWKSSLALWRNAAANEPDSSVAHYNYACALTNAGERAAAAEEYRRSIECNGFQPESHFNLGNALREDGRCDEALREYELSVRVCPTFVRGWLAIAALDAERGDGCAAIAAGRTALALEPDSIEAGHRLARLLFDGGRLGESIAVFDRLTRRHPERAVDHYDYGVALATAERWSDAIREYEAALRLAPDLAVARLNLSTRRRTRAAAANATPRLVAGGRRNAGIEGRVSPVEGELRQFRWIRGCVQQCLANGTVNATESVVRRPASPFRDRVFDPRPLRTALERRPTSLLRHGRCKARARSASGRSWTRKDTERS